MNAIAVPATTRTEDRPLPSGTTMKFVLLIVLILVSSGSIMWEVTADWQFGAQDAWGCLLAAGGDPGQGVSANAGVILAHNAAYQACFKTYALEPRWWVIALWPLALAATAALVFRLLPRWKSRRRQVVPLSMVDHDGLIAGDMERLACRAGLRMPTVVVNPTKSSTGALVFGSTADPTICLHVGLLARRQDFPGRFEAVVLHEYAHIQNGDINLTYATVALWRVFLAVVIVPYAVWSAIRVSTGSLISPLWHSEVPTVVLTYIMVAVMLLLVYLAYSDVLRTREIYADRAAIDWGADLRQWTPQDAPASPRASRRALTSFASLWRSHPRWDLRRNTFTDPSVLYINRSLPMFLTGTAAMLIDALLPSYWLGEPPAGASAGIALAAAILVTGVAGIALWRSALYPQTLASPVPMGLSAGLWFGAGAAFGALLSTQASLLRWLPGQPQYLLVLMLAAGAFSWWITQCAHLWLTVTHGTSRLRLPIMGLVLASGCVMVWAWLYWWQGTGSDIATDGMHIGAWRQVLEQSFPGPTAAHQGMLSTIAVVWLNIAWLEHPLYLAAIVVLFLVPLTGWLVRPAAPLRHVLTASAIGGVVCWLATAGAMMFSHTQRADAGYPGQLFGLLYLGWVFVALFIGMVVAGTVAAAISDRRYSLLTALTSAAVAGLLGFGGWYLLAATDGCLGRLNTMSNLCAWRPGAAWGLGGLLEGPILFAAVLAGVVGAVLATAIGAFISKAADSSESSTLARVRLPRPVLALRCLVISAIVAAVTVAAVRADTTDGQSLSSSTVSADIALIAGTTTNAPPQVQVLQVTYWYNYGGHNLLIRIIGDLRRLISALNAAAANGGQIDPGVFKPLCTDGVRISSDAGAYFPVPAAKIQSLWKTTITTMAKAGHECLNTLAAQNGNAFIKAMDEFAALKSPLETFERDIKTVLIGK